MEMQGMEDTRVDVGLYAPTVAETKRADRGPLDLALNDLHAECSALEEEVGALVAALTPITQPVPETSDDRPMTADPSPPRSQMTYAVLEARHRVRSQRERLASLRSYLDLA